MPSAVTQAIFTDIKQVSILLFRSDELVALAVDIDDLDRGVLAQVLAELGDIHVHAARVEVVVVDPDSFAPGSR